ncbi:hypothetical protein GCM10008097_11290 [Mycetocola manganoxydans]|nr:hypothetical protein GCM10008097_11290 [Mycetocola manganoxydans]
MTANPVRAASWKARLSCNREAADRADAVDDEEEEWDMAFTLGGLAATSLPLAIRATRQIRVSPHEGTPARPAGSLSTSGR